MFFNTTLLLYRIFITNTTIYKPFLHDPLNRDIPPLGSLVIIQPVENWSGIKKLDTPL